MQAILQDRYLENVPLLIFAHSSALNSKSTPSKLFGKKFSLTGITDNKTRRHIKLQLCNAKTGQNIQEGYEWIENICKDHAKLALRSISKFKFKKKITAPSSTQTSPLKKFGEIMNDDKTLDQDESV